MNAQQEETLKRILAQALHREDPPPEEASLRSEGLDSMGLFTLIEALEESFQIRIPEEDVLPENFDSLKGLRAYLDRRLGESGQRGEHERAS
jgi:acyl carrier protein